eukprot:5700314-Amphidinium_carterae.1
MAIVGVRDRTISEVVDILYKASNAQGAPTVSWEQHPTNHSPRKKPSTNPLTEDKFCECSYGD